MKEKNDRLSELQREIDRLTQKVKELPAMHEINRDIASLLNTDKILRTIVNRATSMLKSEIGSILLFDNSHKELVIKAARGLSNDIVRNTRIPIGVGVSGWVAKTGQPLLITDISKNNHHFAKKNGKYYTRSLISVPLEIGGKVIGVININNKRTKECFTQDDLELLKSLAAQASVAVEIAELFENLNDSYLRAIESLTAAIDAKDHYTSHHSKQVTDYALAIAREMHLSPEKIRIIKEACQLHDLGKIGIHDHILTKQGKLTEQEWREIRRHPLMGVEILKPLGSLKEVIELVKEHHERYDGQGYPLGLKKDDIPLGARIIAVADAFSAMVSNRPYRDKMSKKEALEELQREAGHQFDPRVLKAFLEAAHKGNITV